MLTFSSTIFRCPTQWIQFRLTKKSSIFSFLFFSFHVIDRKFVWFHKSSLWQHEYENNLFFFFSLYLYMRESIQMTLNNSRYHYQRLFIFFEDDNTWTFFFSHFFFPPRRWIDFVNPRCLTSFWTRNFDPRKRRWIEKCLTSRRRQTSLRKVLGKLRAE